MRFGTQVITRFSEQKNPTIESVRGGRLWLATSRISLPMKLKVIGSLTIALSIFSGFSADAETGSTKAPATCGADLRDAPRFWDLSAPSLDGKEVSFTSYRRQVALVVNTASRCGHTHQYDALQRVFKKYQSRGFTVLGFPSNDFGGQEPGTNAEIKSFCQLKYGVDFPMFAKAPVVGQGQQAVFRFLTNQSLPADKFLQAPRRPASSGSEVAWNFEKFLIDREGRLVLRARSGVQPEDPRLIAAIEAEVQKTRLSQISASSGNGPSSKSSNKSSSEVPCQPKSN